MTVINLDYSLFKNIKSGYLNQLVIGFRILEKGKIITLQNADSDEQLWVSVVSSSLLDHQTNEMLLTFKVVEHFICAT